MPGASTPKVCHRGQTNLPDELGRRMSMDTARNELRRVLGDRYEAGLAAIDDPDLADQWVGTFASIVLDATVLLPVEVARGDLPEVLDAERGRWRTVDIG